MNYFADLFIDYLYYYCYCKIAGYYFHYFFANSYYYFKIEMIITIVINNQYSNQNLTTTINYCITDIIETNFNFILVIKY